MHLFVVQPAIVNELANQSNTLLNSRLASTKTAITEMSEVVEAFNRFVVEYERQDCDIAVNYDAQKNTQKLQGIVDKLNPTQKDWEKLRYINVLTQEELNSSKERTLFDLMGSGQSILAVANQYTDIDPFVSYLSNLRGLCSKITDVDANKTVVTSTFCSEYTSVLSKWTKPSSEWQLAIWKKSNEYATSCATTSFNTLLTNFISYFSTIATLVPDSSAQKDQLLKIVDSVDRIVADSKESNKRIVQNRSSLSGVWYLLSF